MNKKQKLIKAMEHESIDTNYALESALALYSAEPDAGSQEALFKAIIYMMLKQGKVYTAIMGQNIPENPDDILTGVSYSGFDLRAMELNDGCKVAVAITGSDKLKEVPPTAFFEAPLSELMGYIAEQEIDGLLINPGPDNYFMPMALVKGCLEQWELLQKLMHKY